ncbi:hypothetical protein AB0C77_29125 [Streptomyces sp. NPDC048629]|uniref:hypothetical protein n=1 Tax=Streptomyces sp. NPDC048629 TaxID=3154824 RepID=UPI00343C4196
MKTVMPSLIVFSGTLLAASLTFLGAVLMKRAEIHRDRRRQALDAYVQVMRAGAKGEVSDERLGELAAARLLLAQVGDLKNLQTSLHAKNPLDRVSADMTILLVVLNQERKAHGQKPLRKAEMLRLLFDPEHAMTQVEWWGPGAIGLKGLGNNGAVATLE